MSLTSYQAAPPRDHSGLCSVSDRLGLPRFFPTIFRFETLSWEQPNQLVTCDQVRRLVGRGETNGRVYRRRSVGRGFCNEIVAEGEEFMILCGTSPENFFTRRGWQKQNDGNCRLAARGAQLVECGCGRGAPGQSQNQVQHQTLSAMLPLGPWRSRTLPWANFCQTPCRAGLR
jgi:hypothetical protein